MRVFSPKTFLGWLLLILGGCWKLLGALSTSDFVVKILWPEKPMFSFLMAIILSPWFPFILMVIGLVWIIGFRRSTDTQSKEGKMLPLIMTIGAILILVGILLIVGATIYHVTYKWQNNTIALPIAASPSTTQKKCEPSKEQRLFVEKLIQEYKEKNPKGSPESLVDWVNKKLKEQGQNLSIHLSPQPRSTGIRVEGSKGVKIYGNVIDGCDIGIDVQHSEHIDMNKNIVK